MWRYATRRVLGGFLCCGALALLGCSNTSDVATGDGSPDVSVSAAPASSSTSTITASTPTSASTSSASPVVTAASLQTTTSTAETTTPETTPTTTEPEPTTTTEPEPTTTTTEPLPEPTTTTEPATTTTVEPQPRVIELRPRVGGKLDPYVGVITGWTAGGDGGFNVFAQCRPGPLTVTIHEVGDALEGCLNLMVSADDSMSLLLGPATKGMVISGHTNGRVRLLTSTITRGYRIEYRCIGR